MSSNNSEEDRVGVYVNIYDMVRLILFIFYGNEME